MDEARVTRKSLLNYREIPVVRALDRREVIGCYSASYKPAFEEGFFSHYKTDQLLPVCGMHFSPVLC